MSMGKKKIKLEEIPGVGKKIAERLREVGFTDLMAIAVSAPSELAAIAEIGEGQSRKIINSVREMLDIGFERADKIMKRKLEAAKITTNVDGLDKLLGGGIETQAITEAYGQFASGKCVGKNTQVVFFNDENLHFESIQSAYEQYKTKFGETKIDDGFGIQLNCVKVLGLTKHGIRKVSASMLYKEFTPKLLEIKTKRGRVLQLTKQHKLLSVNKNGMVWTPSGLLSRGDILAVPKTMNLSVVSTQKITADDAYFLGTFVAEGCSNPLSITTADKNLKEWLISYIESRFGYKPTVREYVRGEKIIYLILLRKVTRELLKRLVGTKAETKFIPPEIFTASDEIVAAFLRGYVDGDGYLGNEIELSTKSELLATQLCYILKRFSVECTLRDRIINGEKYYRIFIVGFDKDRLHFLNKKYKIRNSGHGYPTKIIEFLRNLYKETLYGNRGRFRKRLGKRSLKSFDSYAYNILIKNSKTKTISEHTFRKAIEILLKGKEDLELALDKINKLEQLSKDEFKGLLSLLPFPYNTISKVGINKKTLRNYTTRGLPVKKNPKNVQKIKIALKEEIEKRLKRLELGLKICKNIHNLAWDEIEEIKEIDYNDYVYDFVVPDGHTFVGGATPTLFHNTQLAFQLAVDVQLPKDKGGLGKNCLFIDTENSLPYDEEILVVINDKYKFMKIGELVEKTFESSKVSEINGTLYTSDNPEKIKVVSFDPDTLKVGTFEITGFMKHKAKPIFRVKLESGREVRVTEYHNFFKLSRNCDLVESSTKELKLGEFIAVPGHIPELDQENFIDISDLLKGTTDKFYVRGGKEFKELLSGMKPLLHQIVKEENLYYDTLYNWIARSYLPLNIFYEIKDEIPHNILKTLKIGGWSRSNSLPLLFPITKSSLRFFGVFIAEGCITDINNRVILTTRDENVKRWIKDFGKQLDLHVQEAKNGNDLIITSKILSALIHSLDIGSNAFEKRVPSFILGLDKEHKLEFLNAYLICDGSISSITGQTTCETVSKSLSNDLLYLASSLGIPARSYPVTRTYKGTPHHTFNVSWTTNPTHDPKLFWVPNGRGEVGRLIKSARNKINLNMKILCDRLNYANEGPWWSVERGITECVGRSKLMNMISVLKEYQKTEEIEKLERLINGNVWFDKIVSIEKLGTEPTYDVEVMPDGRKIENFVAGKGGIFLHNTFSPNRIVSIAKAMGLDPEKALKNIFVARAFNSEHQIFLIEKAAEMIEEKNIGLIIIDSLTSHFRADYIGRGELARRQQKLNKHLHTLQRLADGHNIAIYITNQVMARPDMLFGDPTTPVGGHVLAHQATYRLYLRKGRGGTRVCKLMDAANLPERECVFKITENGLVDA